MTHPSPSERRWRRPRRPSARALLRVGALALVVLLAALTASACGGGSDDSGIARAADGGVAGTSAQTTTTTAAIDSDEALLAFARCMREEGVDFPDPVPNASGDLQFARPADPGSFNSPAFRDAREACQEHLEGVDTPGGNFDDPEFQDARQAFTECLREEGLDVPDFRPGQGPGPGGAGIDFDDPAVQKAIEACQGLIQGALPGGGQ